MTQLTSDMLWHRSQAKHPSSILRVKKGFSLIEMLLVIAIIAILATIMVPTVNRGILAAKGTKSLAQLRSISQLVELYAQDNDSAFPPSWNNAEGKTYAQYLSDYAYGKDYRQLDSIFISPFARKKLQLYTGSDGTVYSHPISYSANPKIMRDTSPYPGWATTYAVKQTVVDHPTEMIMLCDGALVPSNLNQARADFYAADNWQIHNEIDVVGRAIDVGPDADTDAAHGNIRYPYAGKTSAAMCDGSAKHFRKGTILTQNVYY